MVHLFNRLHSGRSLGDIQIANRVVVPELDCDYSRDRICVAVLDLSHLPQHKLDLTAGSA